MPKGGDKRRTGQGGNAAARPWLLGGMLGTAALLGFLGVWLFQPPAAPRGAGRLGGPFSLVQGDGQRGTVGGFRGKYLLVYFG